MEIHGEILHALHIAEINLCICECPKDLVIPIPRWHFFFPKNVLSIEMYRTEGERFGDRALWNPPSVKQDSCWNSGISSSSNSANRSLQ